MFLHRIYFLVVAGEMPDFSSASGRARSYCRKLPVRRGGEGAALELRPSLSTSAVSQAHVAPICPREREVLLDCVRIAVGEGPVGAFIIRPRRGGLRRSKEDYFVGLKRPRYKTKMLATLRRRSKVDQWDE
jgi:hypothetical protein